MKQTTLIRHDIRSDAYLTSTEYVILSFLDDLKEAGLPLNEKLCEETIHYRFKDILTSISILIENKFIVEQLGVIKYITTDKWKNLFKFDETLVTTFLQPIDIADKKMAWGPSNKRNVTDLLSKMPKKVPFSEILDGKIRYFCYLRFLDWDRRAVAAEVFIGPKEHWKTDWFLNGSDYLQAYKTISERMNPTFPIQTMIDSLKMTDPEIRKYPVTPDECSILPDDAVQPEEDTYNKMYK
jgi:hypothetical protein